MVLRTKDMVWIHPQLLVRAPVNGLSFIANQVIKENFGTPCGNQTARLRRWFYSRYKVAPMFSELKIGPQNQLVRGVKAHGHSLHLDPEQGAYGSSVQPI